MLSRFSCVRLLVTLWTVARQTPLFMGFSKQEYWSGLPCPPPEDLPDPEIKRTSLMSRVLAASSLPPEPPGMPLCVLYMVSVVYVCQSQSPSSSHLPFPAWYPYVCSLHLYLYFCLATKIIYINFSGFHIICVNI